MLTLYSLRPRSSKTPHTRRDFSLNSLHIIVVVVIIIIIIIINNLSNDRSKASSKTIPSHSAI